MGLRRGNTCRLSTACFWTLKRCDVNRVLWREQMSIIEIFYRRAVDRYRNKYKLHCLRFIRRKIFRGIHEFIHYMDSA